jgi:hypothetical protein
MLEELAAATAAALIVASEAYIIIKHEQKKLHTPARKGR